MPPNTFEDIPGLTLTETIRAAMVADGIHHPTDVQSRAITAIIAGQHVLMHSGTGTGKTLAYLLPVLQRLRESEHRAVIFAPGAELVMQTLRVANSYKDEGLTAAAAISTSSQSRQRKRIHKSTRLVMGTPDRLIELFQARKLRGVHTIVLDEIEPILGARDAPFLDKLFSRSEPKVQLIVATATLGQRSEAFVNRYMGDGLRVHAAEAPLQTAISHHVVRVPLSAGKEVVLARFIQEHRVDRAIVFASEPRHLSHLFHYFEEHGIPTATVSRERSKGQRQRGLDAFRAGRVRLLLTTDDAARGIDVPNVSWVLHYDLPRAAKAYLHRAGRTGRAGELGCSVVFADSRTQSTLRRLARELDVNFTPLHIR